VNEKLKQIRTEKNIMSKEMAELLGLKKALYSKKENGQVKFSLEESKKIADYFNMKIEDIFFEDKVSKMETKNHLAS